MQFAVLLAVGMVLCIGAVPPADAQDQPPPAQSRQAPSGSGTPPPSTEERPGDAFNPSGNSNMPVIQPPRSAGSNMPVITPPQSGSNMPVVTPRGAPGEDPQGQPH